MENSKIEILERALERQKAARKAAEKILEEKSRELYMVSEELKVSNEKLEESLSQKTSELEGVFLNIIDAYIVMDIMGNVLSMNDAAVEMLGYDASKESFNLTAIVKEEYLEYTEKAFKDLYEKGFYKNYQAIIKTKNNEEKLVQVNSSIIYNKEGKPIAAQGILRDITQENIYKELIEQQKKQLDIIVDHSPIGISLSRKDDIGLLMANNSLTKMFGFSQEEFKKIKLQDLTFDDDKEISEIKRSELYNDEIESYSLNKRYIKKSGEIVWAKTSVTGVKDTNNKVKFHVTTIEDITKEKRALEKLKDSENRLSTLIVHLQSGILLEDNHKNIQVVNKKFNSLFGQCENDNSFQGSKVSYFHEKVKHLFKYPEQFLDINSLVMQKNDEVYKQELELLDGRVIERNGIPIVQDGVYKGYLWSYYDITIGKRYEESLEAQKEKYSSIIANMNLGLLEVDNNDVILLANQSFCDISGYSLNELVGKKAADLILTDDSKVVFDSKMNRRERGISDSYEVKATSKSGETRNWLISGAPNYNVNGKLIGSIGIHLDITEQKNLEKQKEELLNSLEKQNEQLNEYAHIVSHDLKSPLRSISALLSWTKEDFAEKIGEDSLINLNMMEDKVEKMDKLIGDILNYSSIEDQGMNNNDVNVNEVVERIIDTIFIPNHIKVVIKNKLPIIKADSTRLQQLFQNLISNAINYIDKEKGLVEVDFEDAKDFYIFSIKDNGVGIPKEYHEKIFKIFNTLGDYEKSTGIGLSIVKKVVELYKGEIWLESKVGVGTTFFFSIKK
ncbi:PAS domain-containing sensor histidine kinase [Lutibacter flavus]|uniref:histidine kinase n=1 Tax=Lutibacter flavus TaxID=691689 RepID=A0A238XMP6_9FLAO|nr:PAS domain-containing sensor histidine kinase [Lutibacter flavus]SNR59952.1 PAS/PAC sensor signal transduction histidine kinase [Lutibacter flavus]